MYLGHAAVEDFRGVTRRLAPRGITVRVVRDLGKDGIGDWDWDWDLVCGQLRTVSAVALRGGGGDFPCWEYRCSRSRESRLAISQVLEQKTTVLKFGERAVHGSDLICTYSFPHRSQSLCSLHMQDPFLKRSVAPPRFHCSSRRAHPRIARALPIPDPCR